MPDTLALPNLLIAGVQKGGTTSLHNILATHDDVFMTRVKELRYFSRSDYWRSPDAWEQYLQHFADGREHRYRGECTPHYFWAKDPNSPFCPTPHRPRREFHAPINDTISEIVTRIGRSVQVVVVLRHPVDRAVSAAHHHFARSNIGADDCVWDAPPRLGIVDLGFYKRHILRWSEMLSPDRFHLMVYEQFATDPHAFLSDLTQRLGLPCTAEWIDKLNTSSETSSSVDGSNRRWHVSLQRMFRRNRTHHRDLRNHRNTREYMHEKYRKDGKRYQGIARADLVRLAEIYADDIAFVRSVLGNDVWSSWKIDDEPCEPREVSGYASRTASP